MSIAIAIYFGEWIKSVIPINLIVLLLTCACGLYRNPMLCERLDGRKRILLIWRIRFLRVFRYVR